MDRFFLQVPHDTVRGLGRNHVKQKVKVEEDTLGKQNQQALKPKGLGNMNKSHQVHAFILRFVQEYADPAVIAFDLAQGMQMLQHTANHARHGSNRFQHNRAMTIPTGKKVSAKNRSNTTKA